MTHLDECYDPDGCDCAEQIAAWLSERALLDVRGAEVVEFEARAEGYNRDWSAAIVDEDWRANQCTGLDEFGARCLNRQGHHSKKHDATLNGLMQFHYSPEKIDAAIYRNNPLIQMVPR